MKVSNVCINNGEQSEDVSNEISASTTLSTTVREGKPVDFHYLFQKQKKLLGTLKIHENENIKPPKGYKRKCK